MTDNLSDIQQTPVLLEAQPARLGQSWLILGALVAMTGLGYAAGRLSESAATRSAPPAQAPSPAEAPRPAAAATLAGDDDDDDETARSDEEASDEAPATQAPGPSAEYYVQVASYKAETDAADYAAALTARGLPAQAAPDTASPAWHLVRLGPFPSRGEAEKARFKLRLHERDKAYVTPRSNGKYHVQVGSFATLPEAETVAKRFSATGHVTKISRIKMGERRWHCVRIGPFDAAQEAADYLDLVKAMAPESVVIPYGPPKG